LTRSFEPTISPLLRDRKLAIALLCAALLQLFLFAAKFPGWTCPFLHIVGVPCPGCGLTRATALLLHGNLRAALNYHAFAPVVLLGVIVVGSAGLLPERERLSAINRLELLERRSGITVILLFALILYWLVRLLFMQTAFVELLSR
jgi:uncharacterized protein DUF2752